jgi:hypothetical protein
MNINSNINSLSAASLTPELDKRLLTKRCIVGACPAVYDNKDGTVTIVGKTVAPDADLAQRVDEHEQAVSIDMAHIYAAVFQKLLQAGPVGMAIGDGTLLLGFVPKQARTAG